VNDAANRRILLVDDNESIHTDFRKILGCATQAAAEGGGGARAAFLGQSSAPEPSGRMAFELTSMMQGQAALDELRQAVLKRQPYALAFVDVRMPPGWDGVETIARLWQEDPHLQVVICTAYSDYSLDEITEKLGDSDRLLVLKKPFEPVEVRQLAVALTQKWNAEQRARERFEALRIAERKARQHAASLEESNRALGEANERARSASRAKSDFLANMSHEIRTPMTAIMGYTDLLCDPEVEAGDKVRYAGIVRRSGEHLLTILNDVLDISKIEAGRMSVACEEFSPFDVARDVLSLMAVRAEEKGLELGLEARGNLPKAIQSDPIRLRQILLNLVGNAIKFTERGSVRLVVGMDDPRNHRTPVIRFDVIDTGIGVDESELDRLFDAFRQADGSSTRTAGGTGLGLTISRRLAEMLGGDIDVRSRLGVGSTFSAWIDPGAMVREFVDVRPEDLRIGQDVVPYEEDTLRIDARVLLVEDTRMNQLLISTILTRAGADVSLAADGQQGLEQLRGAAQAGEPFDLVLLDMQMPVMDGYEAARTMRAEGFDLPVVALTAHAMSGDRDRCLAAGCSDYATKPVDKTALLKKCVGWLGGGPPPVLPSPPRSEPTPAPEARDDDG